MQLTQKEKERIDDWRKDAEFHAADLDNEWLKGLYTGEAMAYKIVLRVFDTQKED